MGVLLETNSMPPDDIYNQELRSLRLIRDSFFKIILSINRFRVPFPREIAHSNVVS